MILIIQNGHLATHISKYLDEECEVVKSFEQNVSIIELDKYSIVIILGGQQNIKDLDNCPELKNVELLIKKCIQFEKPVLGICLGCQLIAHVLGCEIKPSGKLNIGYDTKILGLDHIFRCHYDYVVPNESITVLDSFDSMTYAFIHNKLIGIQCHPDIPPEQLIQYQYYPYVLFNQIAIDKDSIINENNKKLLAKLFNLLKN